MSSTLSLPRNNNEVEPYAVRVVSYRKVTLLVASVAFLGCIAVLGIASLRTSHATRARSQISAAEARGSQDSSASGASELTLEDIYSLARRRGSPRLPEQELKQLEDSDAVCKSKECLEAGEVKIHSHLRMWKIVPFSLFNFVQLTVSYAP